VQLRTPDQCAVGLAVNDRSVTRLAERLVRELRAHVLHAQPSEGRAGEYLLAVLIEQIADHVLAAIVYAAKRY
jgi:hypothetical protein